MHHLSLSLCLELLEHLGTGQFQVGLRCDVEHVVDLELRVHFVLGLLFLGEVPVVVIGDLLLGLRIDDGEGREEDRERLLALVDAHLRELVVVLVAGLEHIAVLILDVVEIRDAVEGRPDGDIVSHLLGLHHQHQGVPAVVMAAGEVLGRLCRARGEPGLLPVSLQGLDLVDHQLREPKERLVGRGQIIAVMFLVLCHGRQLLDSSLTHFERFSTRQLMLTLSLNTCSSRGPSALILPFAPSQERLSSPKSRKCTQM